MIDYFVYEHFQNDSMFFCVRSINSAFYYVLKSQARTVSSNFQPAERVFSPGVVLHTIT